MLSGTPHERGRHKMSGGMLGRLQDIVQFYNAAQPLGQSERLGWKFRQPPPSTLLLRLLCACRVHDAARHEALLDEN